MSKFELDTIILVPYAASDVHEDAPGGEATYLYNEYFKDACIIQICGNGLGGRMYIKDSLGLYIICEGKTNAASKTAALLFNDKFDFSNTKFILFGCCGSSYKTGVVGDLYVITQAADFDLGYSADARDLENKDGNTWYPNLSLSSHAYFNLNNFLVDEIYESLKNVDLDVANKTTKIMSQVFSNEDWVVRKPAVIKGSSLTSDTYWKGIHKHCEALHIADYYNFEYPYVATEMENSAVCSVFDMFDMLDKLAILRYSVNMDVFMPGETPENMWGHKKATFEETGFDNFNGLFGPITKCATNLLIHYIM